MDRTQLNVFASKAVLPTPRGTRSLPRGPLCSRDFRLRRFPLLHSRSPQNRQRALEYGRGRMRCEARRPEDRAIETERDYYDILGVSRTADVATIRREFRKRQKKYHPDVWNDGGVKSRELNDAYAVLTSQELRGKYDRKIRQSSNRAIRTQEGLVGPLEVGELLLEESLQCGEAADVDALCSVASSDYEQAVHYIRQWAQTLAYGAEIPLPAPLQVDSIGGGVRIAFITVREGTVEVLGELSMVVVPLGETVDELGEADSKQYLSWGLQVRRRYNGGDRGAFPGEDRVLTALQKALKEIRGENQKRGWELSGVLAAAAQGIFGGIPIWGGMNGGNSSSYEAYYLKPDQQASLEPLPEKWIRAKGNAMSYMQYGGLNQMAREKIADDVRGKWEMQASHLIAKGDNANGEELEDCLNDLLDLVAQMSEMLTE